MAPSTTRIRHMHAGWTPCGAGISGSTGRLAGAMRPDFGGGATTSMRAIERTALEPVRDSCTKHILHALIERHGGAIVPGISPLLLRQGRASAFQALLGALTTVLVTELVRD